tara:strand:+ start:625 stop:1185 length:561 start_codon:yes stop_codon:yes gene_type:complete
MKIDPKYLIMLGLFVYIVYLQNSSSVQTVEDQVIVSTDTTSTTFVDTILFIDTIVQTVFVTVNDPLVINDSVKEYTNEFTDSLLTGLVWTQVSGNMLDQKIDYTPKFPQYIFQVDTLIIKTDKTIIRPQSKFSFNIGLEVGGNEETFNFSPVVGFSNNKTNSYFYRYGVIDKTHSIGLMYNFKFKN